MNALQLLLTVALAVPVAPQAKAQNPAPQKTGNITPSTTAVVPEQLRRVGPPPVDDSASQLEQTGDDLRSENDFPDAIDYYQAAIKKSDSAALHDKIGIAHLELMRGKDAEKEFKRAIKMNPHYAEAYNNLGVVAYMEHKYGRSIKLYKKAITLRGDSASFHSNLGTVYFIRKDYNSAAAEYGRALQLDPNIFDPARSGGVTVRAISGEDRGRYDFVIARIFAHTGDSKDCLLYLAKAIQDGYSSVSDVYKDPEFTKVRLDPQFARVMASKPLVDPN